MQELQGSEFYPCGSGPKISDLTYCYLAICKKCYLKVCRVWQ